MFKAAATRLTHSSSHHTGDSDLAPLQEVIAAQKHVMQSLEKLSVDFTKSSEAMRGWASSEGDDLKDTFSACSTLLQHWVSSLDSFASHIACIRECLKGVRKRDESLEEMRNRRTSLVSKINAAEEKLTKNHKNHHQQSESAMRLREHVYTLDAEITNEEIGLGDYKRVKAREWMGVLFGALQECSEKGVVVAKSCRSVIGHISTETTQTGHARAQYADDSRVRTLVVEAERELQGILFTSEVGDNAHQTWVQPPPIGSPPTQHQQSFTPESFVIPNNRKMAPRTLGSLETHLPTHQFNW